MLGGKKLGFPAIMQFPVFFGTVNTCLPHTGQGLHLYGGFSLEIKCSDTSVVTIDYEYIHTPNKKEILVTTRSVKFNCCVYFGSGVLSRNSAGNKLFLGTTEVLKVSLTVLFTCAQQKASGHCDAQGCFHHSEVHTDPPSARRNYIKQTDLRNICRSTCFSVTLEPMPFFFLTYAL